MVYCVTLQVLRARALYGFVWTLLPWEKPHSVREETRSVSEEALESR